MLASRRGRSLLQLQHLVFPQCTPQHESRATYARQAPGKAATKPVAKKASDEGKLQGSFQQLLKARQRHNHSAVQMPAAVCAIAAAEEGVVQWSLKSTAAKGLHAAQPLSAASSAQRPAP